MITRIELAQNNYKEVRKNRDLYYAFKKYLKEDRQFLPQHLMRGCWTCDFKRFFEAWQEYVICVHDLIGEANNIIAK